MIRTIVVRDTLDWGCDHTDADTAAYEAEVCEAIHAQYPACEVEVSCEMRYARLVLVTTRRDDGRIDYSNATADEEAEIEAMIGELCADVWDRGDFWANA